MLSREQLSTGTAWGLDTAISPKLTIPSKTLQVALQQLRAKRAKLNRQRGARQPDPRSPQPERSRDSPGSSRSARDQASWSIGPGGSNTARPRWKGLQEAITVWSKARVCATLSALRGPDLDDLDRLLTVRRRRLVVGGEWPIELVVGGSARLEIAEKLLKCPIVIMADVGAHRHIDWSDVAAFKQRLLREGELKQAD